MESITYDQRSQPNSAPFPNAAMLEILHFLPFIECQEKVNVNRQTQLVLTHRVDWMVGKVGISIDAYRK